MVEQKPSKLFASAANQRNCCKMAPFHPFGSQRLTDSP